MGKVKVVITGSAGFLGSQVLKTFTQHLDLFKIYPLMNRKDLDLRNVTAVKKFLNAKKPKALINCAAHVGGIAYNALHPIEVFEDNVQIGLNLVKAFSESGGRIFINIMPNCTYPSRLDEYAEDRWWDGPMHESVLTYGLPRKMIWGLCFAYCQKYADFKPVHLIFPNMYGPQDHFDPVRSHALGALIAKIAQAKINNIDRVEIWGTGIPIREWLYVKDAATAVLKTFQNIDKFAPNEILNIGVRKGISIKELAYLIKEIVGWKGKFKFDRAKPDGALKKILVAQKMKGLLGWEPKTGLKEGISKTVDWYFAHLKRK